MTGWLAAVTAAVLVVGLFTFLLAAIKRDEMPRTAISIVFGLFIALAIVFYYRDELSHLFSQSDSSHRGSDQHGDGAKSSPEFPLSLSVSSRQEWMSTNVVVRNGQTITINASNDVVFSDHDPPTGPDGSGTPCYPNPTIHRWTFPAQNLSCHSLIGRIDDGPPFLVGHYFRRAAPSSGRLYLGVNDNWFPDNHGDWAVTVSVSD
jgi:hypothetical protein